MSQGELSTQWLVRRLSAACVLACALHPGLVLAADEAEEASIILPASKMVVAAAPMSAPAASVQEIHPVALAPAAAPAMAPTITEAPASPAEQAEAAAPVPQGNTGLLGLHSAIEFGVLAAARQPAEPANAPFQEQVRRISAGLQNAARGLYPEQMKHVGAFDVYVGNSQDLSTMSSGTGKIAVNAGFSKLNPTDDWMAFVIAREMGHVVAGHHDSNSGASLVVSVLMNFIVPGSGLIKSALSFAGSQLASESGRDKQTKEADEVAMKLLEAAGYTKKSVVLNLRLNPLGEEVSKTSWAGAFRASSVRLTGVPLTMPASETVAQAPANLPQTAAALPVALPVLANSARWQPEELARARPSGLPGPLMLGGYEVPARRVE
jgi:Zn-dependent protease with chaperone function